jgi:membrane protein
MDRLLPAETVQIVTPVLNDVLSSHHVTLLSFGMLGTIWIASAAFDSLIEALDVAYDVECERPLWKSRLLAIGLAAICGAFLLTAFTVTILGPRFGEWLASRLALSTVFVTIWPGLRWTIAIVFSILTVEVLYFLAPNVKQRFAATLPGAILSVIVWTVLSHLLGLYFRDVAHFNRIYGTLGGFIALMVWMYWTSFVLLVGAELNAEFARQSKKGRIQPKEVPPDETSREVSPPPFNHAA